MTSFHLWLTSEISSAFLAVTLTFDLALTVKVTQSRNLKSLEIRVYCEGFHCMNLRRESPDNFYLKIKRICSGSRNMSLVNFFGRKHWTGSSSGRSTSSASTAVSFRSMAGYQAVPVRPKESEDAGSRKSLMTTIRRWRPLIVWWPR